MTTGDEPTRDAAKHEHGAAAAAIDLGTETALLVIGRERADGSLEVLEDHCLATRLGAGLAAGGGLDARAVERTLDVLDTFARRIALAAVPPERVRAAGTSALRRAVDAERFLAQVAERCGLAFEVIDGEREAALAHAAVVADGASAEALVVDVGGGSIEVVGAGGLRHSIELGAVSATDRWLGGAEREAPVDAAAWDAFEAEVAAAAGALPADAATALGEGAVVLLGGTASNLACLDRDLETYEPRLAEGWKLPATAARTWARTLASEGLEERMEHPIESGRAGILPAGLGLLAAVLERLGAERGRVTGRGLRYGLLREVLAT